MTLTNAASLARDEGFRDRVTAAVIGAARAAIADPETGLYESSYARAVVQNPMNYVDAFAWVIATDPAVAGLGSTTADVPDGAIVTSVVQTWAVVTTNPQPN